MKFEKWEGLGNDFVILRRTELDDATVARLCDRRRGIGADGILLVDPARPSMIVRNADGSRPEMCGNGLRCVAGHLAALPATSAKLTVATDAGPRSCVVRPTGEGSFDVEVDMGTARRGADLEVAGLGFLTIDMGNPHAVTFDAFGEEPLARVTPLVTAHAPGGINVELCDAREGEIAVLVWERGVGPTLACGTGACAVAVAACETGRARFGETQRIRLPGGVLDIVVDRDRRVRMTGPARRVFEGEVSLS